MFDIKVAINLPIINLYFFLEILLSSFKILDPKTNKVFFDNCLATLRNSSKDEDRSASKYPICVFLKFS